MLAYFYRTWSGAGRADKSREFMQTDCQRTYRLFCEIWPNAGLGLCTTSAFLYRSGARTSPRAKTEEGKAINKLTVVRHLYVCVFCNNRDCLARRRSCGTSCRWLRKQQTRLVISPLAYETCQPSSKGKYWHYSTSFCVCSFLIVCFAERA